MTGISGHVWYRCLSVSWPLLRLEAGVHQANQHLKERGIARRERRQPLASPLPIIRFGNKLRSLDLSQLCLSGLARGFGYVV